MANFQIVPAAAGYYALCHLPETGSYKRFPIIGWQVEVAPGGVGGIYPLTDGMAHNKIEAILCPDGSVNQAAGGEFWPSIDEWLASTGIT